MIWQKDLFYHLKCFFSIKETIVNLSENVDLIDLCHLLGEWHQLNDAQNCGSIPRKSRGLSRSQVQSIGLVETTVDRESVQSLRSLSTTTNIRGTLESTKSNDQCLASNHQTCPRQNHCTYSVSKMNLHSILADLFWNILSRSSQEDVQRVIVQYKYLWSKAFVNMLFESIPTGSQTSSITGWRKKRVNAFVERCFFSWSLLYVVFKDTIRAKFEKLFSSKTSTEKLTTDELTQLICRITTFYQKLI